MSELYNIEVEKGFLSCLIQYPDSLAEVSIINEKDFSPINGAIFKIISNEINKGKEVSTILLADKIKGYNIQLEGVDAYDYLEALKLLPINEKEIESLAKQLKKLTVLREYEEIGKNIVKKARASKSEDFVDIVNGMDKMFNEKVNQFSGTSDEPRDLFDGIEDEIEGYGNNPMDRGIIASSFPQYTRIFGSYSAGDIFVTAARSKSGKSTLLMNLAYDVTNNQNNGETRVLYVDSEMESNRVARRILASICKVPVFYLKTGLWRKNPEMVKKVREAWKEVPKYMNKIDHIYVGGKPFDEVVSMIRRWAHKVKSRFSDTKIAIFYDYIKLGSEMPSNAVKDYVIIGKKVDSLKQLATDLQCPVITACQTNRSNEGRKDASTIVDDGSSIGLSDQINQFSSQIMILRKTTIEEAQEFGNSFTHLWIPVYSRELGEDPSGTGLVKYLDDKGKIKLRDNFIMLSCENFQFREVGDLRTWVKANGRTLATESQIEQEKKEGLF